MYIAEIRIQNYRSFKDVTVEFNPGVNVIIGENNAGKTALLRAIGLVFDRNRRNQIDIYDFCRAIQNTGEPPTISISVVLRSSGEDTTADEALVATWLTKPEDPWEARLTYRYFLPDDELSDFQADIGSSPDMERFWNVVERYLPKYIARIYRGEPDSQIRAEPEELRKFDYQFLDAIRDVESELFSGSNPLLRSMLRQVLDQDVDTKAERQERETEFLERSNELRDDLIERLDYDTLFNLVEETGAEDGGRPTLHGSIRENDLITALKLFVTREGVSLPATHNGLGYNNLLYISLVLASLDFESSTEHRGLNAIVFPMLLIEEPEAHLHPALQYKLLKYLQKRMTREGRSRQIFVTTHSTHITAASGLDPIICMSISSEDDSIGVSYPGRVFANDPAGQRSKKYVERYLDATKSNMLFVKGIIFVEGIAEQLLVPCLAEYVESPLEENHVAVIGVGGLNFKHFLPIFGAGVPEDKQEFALQRPVACVVDADPRKRRRRKGARRKKCWPFQIDLDSKNYEYFPVSGTVQSLTELSETAEGIIICSGSNTLEFDLAAANADSTILITDACKHSEQLETFILKPNEEHEVLRNLPDPDAKGALERLSGEPTRKKEMEFATYYLLCTEGVKGEHAFELEYQFRQNLSKPADEQQALEVPAYIDRAIRWACSLNVDGVLE